MDWFPIVFGSFKVIALGTGMFFAVKWHYDRARQDKQMEKREVLLAGGKIAAAFVLSLLGLGGLTFELIKVLGM